jgi:hypothetical protein
MRKWGGKAFSFYPIFAFPKIERKTIGSGAAECRHSEPGEICQRPRRPLIPFSTGKFGG